MRSVPKRGDGGGESLRVVHRAFAWLKVTLIHLDHAAARSAAYSERHFRLLGLLTILHPLAYAVDFYVGQPSFDTLGIRVLALVAALPLIFHDSKFIRGGRHFHLYFVGVVAYVFPFSFGLMLTLNTATVPAGQQIEMLWILQYVIALFLFIQLINHGGLATLLWVVTTLLAFGSLILVENINWTEFNRVMVYPVTTYLTALFIGIITNRNVEYVNLEKLRAASAVGGNIAHELRTPLASIRSLARAMNRHSHVLVDSYVRAREMNVHTGDLSREQVKGLRAALELIEREVSYSNTIIDMLLLNTSEKSLRPDHMETFPIDEALSEAIRRFPFNNSHERNLVSVQIDQSYEVTASRILIVHVFFNLLKNAIHYAQKRPGGTVLVRVMARGKKVLEVMDTGPGIDAVTRKYVFDRFYSKSSTSQGAGIGLSFCKSVMESLGGSIHCYSNEGEFTTFRLVFP